MNTSDEDDFIRVGDHDPERKHPTRQMGKLAALQAQYGGQPLRFTLHNPVPLPSGFTVRYGTMRDDEYLAVGLAIHEAMARDNAQVVEYVWPKRETIAVSLDPPITWRSGDGEITPEAVNRAVEDAPPRLDGPACRCHERMGNDWYFLPSDRCLYDINECRHRRKT